MVNQDVLTERNRTSRPFLKRLFNTIWDLIIVDEAHHYARPTQPSFIFFSRNGGRRTGDDIDLGWCIQNILALTATPFELDPNELVQLPLPGPR